MATPVRSSGRCISNRRVEPPRLIGRIAQRSRRLTRLKLSAHDGRFVRKGSVLPAAAAADRWMFFDYFRNVAGVISYAFLLLALQAPAAA